MAKTTTSRKSDKAGAKETGTGAGKASTGVNRNAGAVGQQTNAENSAIAMLRQDHRKVEGLFRQFGQSSDDGQKEELVEQICEELILHMRLEEEIFYPACREAGVEDDRMDESQVEHDGAKAFINDLLRAHSGEPFWEAKVSVLKELIEHHVEEEEKPGEGAFAQAEEHDIDDEGLAPRLKRRKEELQRRDAGRQPIRPLSLGPQEGRGGGRGRSMGDDERGYGRFARYREEDDRRSGNGGRGGHGGWFGDSEGHAEAARSRRGEGYGRYADDERYGDSERYGNGGGYGRDDDRDRDRDARGRFMSDDDRRHDRDRDDRGRFMREDDDGRRYSARSRDDDDRRYSGPSRRDDDDDERRHGGGSHGGWFGDARAHAEASRRGWQHRR
jgi:hypothetical protein